MESTLDCLFFYRVPMLPPTITSQCQRFSGRRAFHTVILAHVSLNEKDNTHTTHQVESPFNLIDS